MASHVAVMVSRSSPTGTLVDSLGPSVLRSRVTLSASSSRIPISRRSGMPFLIQDQPFSPALRSLSSSSTRRGLPW